ncbi:hypothetical protein [Streptomyces brasiliensis]|uniref:Uncharacterized protein n=1 Tax=Streptomyces brasiliensis TaxID=1954 RepID=A0A917P9S6_9ACTN|nr:hypothetical protein [Streptomyces brasiliensis]GGJ67965.1 hypothetical protein GCM10010121_093330 [Streptomyces brasiliensis]
MITPDPATPEGEAIIGLHEQMNELQERTDRWPGADTVDILGTWLARFDFTGPVQRTRLVAGSVWVLRREDRHADEVTLWNDEASALAALAEHVRSSWDNVRGDDGIPDLPPVRTDRIPRRKEPHGHEGTGDAGALRRRTPLRQPASPSTSLRRTAPTQVTVGRGGSLNIFAGSSNPVYEHSISIR